MPKRRSSGAGLPLPVDSLLIGGGRRLRTGLTEYLDGTVSAATTARCNAEIDLQALEAVCTIGDSFADLPV